MPPASDRPLQKVTLNLFADDVAFLSRSPGWTETIRDLVSKHVKFERQLAASIKALFDE